MTKAQTKAKIVNQLKEVLVGSRLQYSNLFWKNYCIKVQHIQDYGNFGKLDLDKTIVMVFFASYIKLGRQRASIRKQLNSNNILCYFIEKDTLDRDFLAFIKQPNELQGIPTKQQDILRQRALQEARTDFNKKVAQERIVRYNRVKNTRY